MPTQAEQIRALNDAFRRSFEGGRILQTPMVSALPGAEQAALCRKVREIANAALGTAGLAPIDPRSHAARGLTEPPGQHYAPDRQARRARREEGVRMGLDEDLIAARNELAAAADIRQRYPILSARPDWPPEQRQATGYLPPEVKAEHDRFWREVYQHALEPERDGAAAADGRDEAERTAFAGDIEALSGVAAGAAAQENVLDRHIAVEDARAAFADMRDRMVTAMVRAGLMDPRTAEHVRMIEQKLYPDEFSRMRAEAQRIEAKRREVGPMPTPTPAMLRQAAAMERAEEERAQDAYEAARRSAVPPVVASPAQQGPAEVKWGWFSELLARVEAEEPVPDPDGRPISAPELREAEERMIAEVEQPVRAVPQPPWPEQAPAPERDAATVAVERQNDIEVPAVEAEGYRLAPQEDRLDWLQAVPQAAVEERQPERATAQTEDRLDWLTTMTKPQPEPAKQHEPDRYQR